MKPRARRAAAVVFAAAVAGCTNPGAPVTAEGAPASAELLGVSLHGTRIYVVRDTKRNVTCWVPVSPSGSPGGIHCEPDVAPAPPAAAAPARTDTSVPAVPAGAVTVPGMPPLPPVPPR